MQDHVITLPQRIARLLCGTLLAGFINTSLPAHATDFVEHGVRLRVHIGDRVVLGEDDLQRLKFRNEEMAQDTFRRNVIPIKPGQSIQRKVKMVHVHGRATDVTNTGAVEYQSASPWKLNVSPDGLVTTAPSSNEPALQRWADSVGDTAIHLSLSQGATGAWNKIFFIIEQ